MVRIIVFGGWFGSGNIGDDAILIGLNGILTRVLPDAELVAISSDPDQTRRVCGVEAVPLLSTADVARTGGGSLRPYFNAFRDADACIVSGGTPFYDYGHVSRTLHFSLPVLRGKTIHCFGVGVKPIRSKLGGGLIRALVEQAESISTRDRLSRAELLRLGVKKPVAVTGDSSLFAEPSSSPTGLRKLGEAGVNASERMVAICPRRLSLDYSAHYHEPLTNREINGVRRTLAEASDHLLEAGFEVVFLPMHCTGLDNDLDEIKEVRGLMRNSGAKVLRRALLPSEAMAVLGHMKAVLGLRLHSLIFAAAQGVPIISIDYDPKIRGFMELAGIEDYLFLPSDPPRAIIAGLEMALDEAGGLKRVLSLSCTKMKERITLEAEKLFVTRH